MNKIVKRLKERFKQLKLHPVTKGREIRGIINYISFHIKNRIVNNLKYKWIENLKFIARKGDAGLVGNITFGLFEFEESIFLLHLLREEDVFLDVGANLGHYSLLMSGIKHCKSIAIEPVPKTYSQLLKQIKLNKLENLVETKNIGVSNKNEMLFFSTDKGTMDCVVPEEYVNSTKVIVDVLDNIIDNNIPRAIKIDVEGYEKFVLDGAKNLLKNEIVKAIVIELNSSGKKYNNSDNQVYEMILKFGFKPYEYDYYNREVNELNSYNKNKFNTLFLRDISFVEKRIKESKNINIKGRLF